MIIGKLFLLSNSLMENMKNDYNINPLNSMPLISKSILEQIEIIKIFM